MINSLAQTTLKQYQVTHKLWWTYCHQKGVTPFCATDVEILSFFQHLLDTSAHNYSTFNSHQPALVVLLPNDVGNNIYLNRFLKGVKRQRPTKPRYLTNNLVSRISSSVSEGSSSYQWTLTGNIDLKISYLIGSHNRSQNTNLIFASCFLSTFYCFQSLGYSGRSY